MRDHGLPTCGTESCPASPALQNRLGARATHARPSRAESADATRPPWSSTSAASPGSPEAHPGPGVRQPTWVRNLHNAVAGVPKSSAPTGPLAFGSMAGLVIREPGNDPLVREDRAASAAPGGRLLSTCGGGYLRQMLLLYLEQYLQSVPFWLAQSDSLRLHRAHGHP